MYLRLSAPTPGCLIALPMTSLRPSRQWVAEMSPLPPSETVPARRSGAVTPLIVFQGDRDKTVAPSNADTLVKQAIGEAAVLAPETHVSEGEGTGRGYTRSTYTTARGDVVVEFWQIHGAGHAWSGGSADGTYTDPQGPDASAEMVRFFLQINAG